MIHMEDMEKALDMIRPKLRADGGDIELISIEDDGRVKVKLTGACGSCPMSIMTLKMGIEAYLKEIFPELTEVVPA
ncbi:NifU family protein [Treponema phagedenis]|uniref:NifU family protein n=1 Tax=Treponema phagedenis TaxID=162 RepID=A0A0B7GZH9_TREPH|nr:NifU family protein [Treponema phagedenis]NVP22855.1 NifU family protein [Treponema phagedenis]QEJ94931.1 NifU family protein [Treponema phagedenis]QEJ98341.1 NifU family protein [Treponema phagedenis]QEK00832.1 NifU family protein [Treponema phagedenis]QEK03851.1 NifU family protein [Treponema phagedenis]